MTRDTTPEGQVDIGLDLAVRLLTTQFPHWGHLPIAAIESSGTDNALFSLGDDMVIRMPRATWATEQVDKEQEWLPRLAPHLPLAIPLPLARGRPDETYPWTWSVYRWLAGEDVHTGSLEDLNLAAADLAKFIRALQRIDQAGGPRSGKHNNYRGVPLAVLDPTVRRAIASLEDLADTAVDTLVDTGAALRAWEAALEVPLWKGAPVWIHGDLQAGNLLVQNGRLNSVIDFGLAGVGDPACDLIVAWNLLAGESRDVFRVGVNVDDATWARGRGWALYTGLVALPYYLHTNPVIVRTSRHVISEVLADHA